MKIDEEGILHLTRDDMPPINRKSVNVEHVEHYTFSASVYGLILDHNIVVFTDTNGDKKYIKK